MNNATLDQHQSALERLIAFLNIERKTAGTTASLNSPILLGELMPRERKTDSRSEASPSSYLPVSLSKLAADGELIHTMKTVVLGFIEERFPLTGRPIDLFHFGERCVAASVVVFNLSWWEALDPARKRRPKWLRWMWPGETRIEDNAMTACRELMKAMLEKATGERSAEVILLHALLDRLMAGHSLDQSTGGRWWEIWNGILMLSPVTRLMQPDLLSTAAQQSAKRGEQPGSGWYDWSGLHDLMARTDFDAEGVLLQRFLHALQCPDLSTTEIEKLIQSVITQLHLRDLAPELPERPTAGDLEQMLLHVH